jgi:hypothetical protein
MPSTSIKQRNFFQLVLQVKTNKIKRSEVDQKVLDVVYSDMTIKDIKDMASTTDKEIKKNESVTEISHELTPMNVNGMGEVQLPSNPGSSTDFSSQETGSGDIPTLKRKKRKKRMFLYIQDYDKFSANKNR